MGAPNIKDAPPLVDLGDCRDIFLSGVGKVERLPGNCFRFVCYVEETDEGGPRRTVAAKVIWPADVLPKVIRQALDALAREGHAMIADQGGLRLTH